MRVLQKTEMIELLKKYRTDAILPDQPSIITCSYDNSLLWEINFLLGYKGVFVNLKNSTEYQDIVLNALDICGAMDITVSIGLESKNISDSKWLEWFLGSTVGKKFAFDTNFILNHYFSSKILPKLSSDDIQALNNRFLVPKMVVLELERMGNEKNTKFEKEKRKRSAFYGAKEIQDLRKLVNCKTLLADNDSVMEFAARAGEGFSDMAIRKEIHDYIAINTIVPNKVKVILLTCDLMNSLAAEAEGISSCYFSRLPQDDYNVGSYDAQFFNFILANAVLFGKIKIENLTNNRKLINSFTIEGMWTGKTTAEWYTDSLRIG